MSITSLYSLCFLGGVIWAVFVGLLPNAVGGRPRVSNPDGGGTTDGGDSRSTPDDATVLSPWSPVVVAAALTAFGAGGSFVQRLLQMPLHVHLPAAFACGLAVGTLTYSTLKLAAGSR